MSELKEMYNSWGLRGEMKDHLDLGETWEAVETTHRAANGALVTFAVVNVVCILKGKDKLDKAEVGLKFCPSPS